MISFVLRLFFFIALRVEHTTKIQVTLSQNVHKFVELSQRIVVEKSVIQKYEQETKPTTLNRIRSTQEISSQCYNRTAVMTTSSSSSNVLEKTTEPLWMSPQTPSPTDEKTTATTIENDGSLNIDCDGIQRMCPNPHSNAYETFDESVKEISTKNLKQRKVITTKSSGSKTVISSSGSCSNFTTTKLPLPESIKQRPLKPQSEMDFSVPYNIINNYFSVGVVSLKTFIYFFPHFILDYL